MKFPSPVQIKWIASHINAELIGETEAFASGINEIHRVENGDLVFVDHPKYYDTCLQSAASFIIINKAVECPPGKALLVVAEPFEAYLKIVSHFNPFVPATASIDPSSLIGEGTYIAPNVFIGHHVSIREHCIIGNNVIIQPGSVIGSDAFYYNSKKDREVWYKKMSSCGRVIIDDDVEIGAGCTIDRGVTHDTMIGRGSKLDNLVHIGHDVVVGKNCLFAAQVAIAGATKVEDGVILWGQVGVSKTLTIGKNAVVLGQSGVSTNLEDEARKKMKELAWIKRIPEIWEKINSKG